MLKEVQSLQRDFEPESRCRIVQSPSEQLLDLVEPVIQRPPLEIQRSGLKGSRNHGRGHAAHRYSLLPAATTSSMPAAPMRTYMMRETRKCWEKSHLAHASTWRRWTEAFLAEQIEQAGQELVPPCPRASEEVVEARVVLDVGPGFFAHDRRPSWMIMTNTSDIDVNFGRQPEPALQPRTRPDAGLQIDGERRELEAGGRFVLRAAPLFPSLRAPRIASRRRRLAA